VPAASATEILLIAAIVLFGGLGSLFWIWMLADCLQSRSLARKARIRWALLIGVTHCVGAGIYFFWRRRTPDAAGTNPLIASPPDPSLHSR
jgi:hypothetical protein